MPSVAKVVFKDDDYQRSCYRVDKMTRFVERCLGGRVVKCHLGREEGRLVCDLKIEVSADGVGDVLAWDLNKFISQNYRKDDETSILASGIIGV